MWFRAGKAALSGSLRRCGPGSCQDASPAEAHGDALCDDAKPLQPAVSEEEREMIPVCRRKSIGVIPWSPLARGLLANRPEETPAVTN